jgi:hypothetical protein
MRVGAPLNDRISCTHRNEKARHTSHNTHITHLREHGHHLALVVAHADVVLPARDALRERVQQRLRRLQRERRLAEDLAAARACSKT